jgi:acetyl esterase
MSMMTRDDWIALLDPELTAYLDRPSEDLNALPLPIAREQANAALRALSGPVKRPPTVVRVPGLAGDPLVEVRVHHAPSQSPERVILHIHGGGMVKGSAGALDGRMVFLADLLSATIVSVDYRKAPETPFPGPLHDCVAAWNWMVAQAPIWGMPASSCIITGDSSGGGLAAATTLYLRDTGGPMPAGQVLVYPMLDYLTGAGASEAQDQRLGWNGGNNQFGWRALLGAQPVPTGNELGHFSPAHAPNLKGLPATWIGVGTIDLFLAEDVAFAARLAGEGGDITLCTYKGAPHGFHAIDSRLSRRFYHDYRAAFARMGD